MGADRDDSRDADRLRPPYPQPRRGRPVIPRIARRLGAALLWLVVVIGLAVTIVPHFLDRQYYSGPVSNHFDGQHFFNPDGEDTAAPPTGGSRAGFFWRYLTASDDRPKWPDRVNVTPVAYAPTPKNAACPSEM